MPGDKGEEKIKLAICPKTGMSKRVAASPTSPTSANKIVSDNRRHFLISRLNRVALNK